MLRPHDRAWRRGLWRSPGSKMRGGCGGAAAPRTGFMVACVTHFPSFVKPGNL